MGVGVKDRGIRRIIFTGHGSKRVGNGGLLAEIGYEKAKAYWSPVENGKKELDVQAGEGSPVGGT